MTSPDRKRRKDPAHETPSPPHKQGKPAAKGKAAKLSDDDSALALVEYARGGKVPTATPQMPVEFRKGCSLVKTERLDGFNQWREGMEARRETEPERIGLVLAALERAEATFGGFGGASQGGNGEKGADDTPSEGGFGGFGGAWREPKPIRAELSPVPPMTPEMIPAKLRPWLVDVSYRMSCALDFVAVGAVVTLASVIGRSVAIFPKRRDDWKVIPNLWGGIVAPPGALKSPALEEVKKPLERLSVAADKAHALSIEDFNARVLMAKIDAKNAGTRLEKARKAMNRPSGGADSMSEDDMLDLAKSITQAETMVVPSAKRYILQTSSAQAMQKVLGENPRGLMRFEDELIKILQFLEDPKNTEAKGLYLTAWNGGANDNNDTLSRGRVKAKLTLSILGGIQPGPLLPYVRAACGGAGDDGFMQRFQVLAYPDEPGTFVNVDEFPNREARELAYTVYEFLDRLEEEPNLAGAERGTWDDEKEVPCLRFDDDSQKIFNSWYEPFINDKVMNCIESNAMKNHLAKYRSLFPSLALIFHLVDVASGESKAGPVTAKATGMAAEWCLYLEAHARRIYQASFDADPEPGKKLLARIQKGAVPSPFTVRWIYRRDWSGLDKDGAERAVNCLEEHGYIRAEETPPGADGRPTTLYHIHPDYPRKATEKEDEKS